MGCGGQAKQKPKKGRFNGLWRSVETELGSRKTHGSCILQKARKTFAAHLSNMSQQGGNPFPTGAAPLAVAYAEAEARRRGAGHLPLALHALAWLACPPSKFVALQEKSAQMPSEARCVVE